MEKPNLMKWKMIYFFNITLKKNHDEKTYKKNNS